MTHQRSRCDACGAPVFFVLVIPELPRRGEKRRHVPLDLDFDVAQSDTAPSHALSTGRTTCRVITDERPLMPYEHPALTHFATCPMRAARRSEVTA
jgi:hypothetical protein